MLARIPVRIAGSTDGASLERVEPTNRCGRVENSVWYRIRTGRRGPIALRLWTLEGLDGVVSVYETTASRNEPLLCRPMGVDHVALAGFYGRRGGEYAISVAERRGGASGDFRLAVLRPEARAIPPGRPLASGSTRSTVHALLDPDDAWSYPMTSGRSYRINLVPGRSCVSASLYRPHAYRFAAEEPVARLVCGGYTLFTPGPDGGGTYSLLIDAAPSDRGVQPYRLGIGEAEIDDAAPGMALGPNAKVSGSLSGRGIDLIDLYRFTAAQSSQLDVRLAHRPRSVFSMRLMHATGERISFETTSRPGLTEFQRRLPAGHYFLALRAEDRTGGPYQLQVRVRGITTVRMSISGRQYLTGMPREPQVLAATVWPAAFGGRVRFQFDRRDPLFGWQFVGLAYAPVGPSGFVTTSWTPPTVGHWRVRARFLGTDTAAASVSGYGRIFVAEPIARR